MGIRSVLLLMVCISAFPAPQANAQFVTLEGRQFMLDGTPFYPRVMNYGVSFATNGVPGTSDPSLIYLSPDGPYDRLNDDAFEYDNQADCEAQLLLHFQKIASMGFNAVRIVRAVPEMYKSSPTGSATFKLPVRPNTGQWHANYLLDLDLEEPTELAARYFSLVNGMLDQARDAGLKVILLSGVELSWLPPKPDNAPELQFLQQDADLYAELLNRLSGGLKEQTTLMAYDVLNEPAWRTGTRIRWVAKKDVCDYTTMWYNDIKAGSEGRHLVTLGGATIPDFGNWDPAIMKLDFYSPHPYIEPSEFDGYDMFNAEERYKAELYWTARISTMPWMIGETGFSADDDGDFQIGTDQSWVLLRPEQEYHEMPYMHGSELEQADFAEMSMDLTREYMGSGYSWWSFQNSKSPPITADPKDYLGNFWAPLGYGDGVEPWRHKSAVQTFETYTLPPPSIALPAPPSAYENWYSLPTPLYRTYHAQDQHEQPVVDALAEMEWIYEFQLDSDILKSFWNQSVSRVDGSVVMYSRIDNFPGYFIPDEPNRLNFHASGAPGYANQSSFPDGTMFTFRRDLLEYATTVADIELEWEPGKEYKAWAELTVENVSIQASGTEQDPVDFMARQFVHVLDEFHAGVNSEVWIRTEPTFPDCTSPWLNMPPPEPFIQADPKMAIDSLPEAGSIELRFLPVLPALSAFPNPCLDRLTIEGEPQGAMKIFDTHGALVHEGTKRTDQLIVDTRPWLPGVYRVRIEIPEGLHTLSITKV
jgi:hypothetical protein